MLIILKTEEKQLCIGLTHEEFRCSCNHPSCRATLINPKLLNAFAAFRTKVAMNLHILSGYRCPLHNFEEKGAERSRHTAGDAIDIAYGQLKDKYTQDQITKLLKACGFTFILHYPKNGFVHADVR